MQTNIQRQLAMLEHIPRHPRRVTAENIAAKLQDRDFSVSVRTVQRELKAMYELGLFGLVQDNRNKPFGWSIAACWRGLNITFMDHHMALAFHTLKHSASQLLPPQSVKQLTPYFERADQVLGSDPNNPWLYWACRVAQLPEPFPIINTEPDPQALETVQYALLHKRQLACQIQRVIKGKCYWIDYQPLNPEGIKIADGVPMLAFTVGRFHAKRYAKPISLLRNIRLLDTPALTRDDFEIAQSGEHPASPLVDIELHFSPSANFILRDAKLSVNQKREQLEDGRYRVLAKVKDTPRLRTFIWEMADSVEVIAPDKLRAHFIRLSHKINAQYQTTATGCVATTD